MTKTSLPDNMVELEDAMDRIARWRNGSGAEAISKAFFISRADIDALYNEMNLLGQDYIGVRVYMGAKEKRVNNVIENVEELLLVAVVRDNEDPDNTNGIDLYQVGDNKETRIYDLTSPCPRMCDSNSPLFTLSPPGEKAKLNLSDLTKK